ncbi:MAG: alkane 1-monooxygenase [Paracoccaceae bacterium]|nr:alkane 1-monooxygenase [Paracoccaceae bacterium]
MSASLSRFSSALPFWGSLILLPLAAVEAIWGGWTLLLLPVCGWGLVSLLDRIAGLNKANLNPATPDADLFWYRLITLIWFPIQFGTIYGLIWYTTHVDHLASWEKFALFFGVGVISGSIGINYAHELMHRRGWAERWLGDLLLATVLYSHFRTEHLQVHHRYVATPRDAVTARYNEGFHRFFVRVLREGPKSAWRAERQLLARAGRGVFHRSNPFWRFGVMQLVAIALAFAIGGWIGLALFLWQAYIAVWQLELTNYIEHYGLTRLHLGDGKYENVQPRHSWNAEHKVSNWLLINLQRHSDHHYKPDRRFPLLQTYSPDEAPQLPYGYPAMTALAMIPPLWRRAMNPRVRAWRRQFYPEVSDWTDYNKGRLPFPKGAS